MKKIELLEKVKQLDGLTSDEKSYLINLINTKKKYGLVWEDKPEDVEEELRTKLPVLKEVKERAIINTPPLGEPEGAYPNHILIEGDNLHALTALTFTHEGKIDVIYIDPPYNTGNKDFMYNDAYVDKEDSYRHSKWLGFMEKRLKIAKRLLSEKGVIFISIDDHENAQLRLLCDEILGEDRFVGCFIWHKKYGGGGDNKNLVTEHEYVLSYSKMNSISNQVISGIELDYDDISGYTLDEENRYFSSNESILMRGPNSTPDKRPNLCYAITDPDGNEILPRDGKGTWCYGKETLASKLKANELIWKNIKGNWMLYKKQFLYVEEENVRQKKPRSILDKRYSIGQTGEGTTALNEILKKEKVFVGPKAPSLIKMLLTFGSIDINNTVILDFFAGSGTTMHATMTLNAEDEGNRQCILVTNNENKICEEVTYERNKKVIQGYTNAKGVEVAGLNKNNLRYYQTAFVSRETSIKNKKELTRLATELLCIKEDTYYECTSEWVKAKQGWVRFFTNNVGRYLCIIYDDMKIEESITAIKLLMGSELPGDNIKVYVFSNGQYPYTEDFEEVLENITLSALPDAIYKAYQNVLPKKNKLLVPELEEPSAEELESEIND